jgi:uncharacterized protein
MAENRMKTDIVGRGWHFPPKIGSQGGLALTNDRNEIEQAMGIIIMTVPGQRVMRPAFGCRIHELLFAPNNQTTAAQAARFVKDALLMWEPRVTIRDVQTHIDPDMANRLLIEVKYSIKSTGDPRSLVFPFYLIPEE